MVLSAEDHQARLVLYSEGRDDRYIARALGVSPSGILLWRKRQGFVTNTPSKSSNFVDHDKRSELYKAGLSDVKIAAAVGRTPRAILSWRNSRGLPPNCSNKAQEATESACRMLLYQLGWSDCAIARERGRHSTSIYAWRGVRGLPANEGISGTPTAGIESLVRRVRRAVGYQLASDIAQDAAGDLALALLEGKLSLHAIEREARKYGNRTLERFASKFGPRSLDEEIGSEDGYTLLDTMRDDSQSSWLEEMGATVW